MIAFIYMALGLLLGYTLAVGSFLVATMGIASAAPAFAVREYRIATGYKLLQSALWLGCTFLGGLAAALLVGDFYPVIEAVLLAAELIAVLWMNTWEARQRGLPHQILMSVMTVAGVTLGFLLAYVLLKPVAG